MKLPLAPSALIALLMSHSPAYAEVKLEEVIVTAQSRSESVQDVPISVNVVTDEALRANGISNIEDLSGMVPNLNIGKAPGGNQMVVIRGLGSGAANPSFENSVGLYVDGIYAARGPQFQIPFLDVERIEVLRGPQGVLFGKNSIAGAIAIHSALPGQTTELSLDSSYRGSPGVLDSTATLSGPLGSTVAGRLVVKKGESGKFMYNGFTHQDEPQADIDALRGIVAWDATDHTTVKLKLERAESSENGTNFQISHYDRSAPQALFTQAIIEDAEAGGEDFEHNRNSFSNANPEQQLLAKNASLEVSSFLGDYELKTLAGYSEYDISATTDVDFSASNFLTRKKNERYQQQSLETRFISPIGKTLEYVTGLFYIQRDLDIPGNRIDVDFLRPPYQLANTSLYSEYQENSEAYSVFGQTTWNISDLWRATLGLRYSNEVKAANAMQSINAYGSDEPTDTSDPTKLPGHLARMQVAQMMGAEAFSYDLKREENSVDGTLNIQWDFLDSGMLYFTLAKATKAGGFNATSTPSGPEDYEFDTEEAISYELGMKSDLFDRRARISLAVFYTEFDNLQVSAFDGTSFKTGNAASATTKGIELETNFALSESWRLGVNLAYLDALYDDYNGSCPSNSNVWTASCQETDGASQNLSGTPLDLAPEKSGAFFLNYQAPLNNSWLFGFRLDASYSDDYYYKSSLDPNNKQSRFWKYNSQISLSTMDGTWTIAVNGFNLSDEITKTFGGEALQAPGLYWANTQAPREFSLSLRYHFER